MLLFEMPSTVLLIGHLTVQPHFDLLFQQDEISSSLAMRQVLLLGKPNQDRKIFCYLKVIWIYRVNFSSFSCVDFRTIGLILVF